MFCVEWAYCQLPTQPGKEGGRGCPFCSYLRCFPTTLASSCDIAWTVSPASRLTPTSVKLHSELPDESPSRYARRCIYFIRPFLHTQIWQLVNYKRICLLSADGALSCCFAVFVGADYSLHRAIRKSSWLWVPFQILCVPFSDYFDQAQVHFFKTYWIDLLLFGPSFINRQHRARFIQ